MQSIGSVSKVFFLKLDVNLVQPTQVLMDNEASNALSKQFTIFFLPAPPALRLVLHRPLYMFKHTVKVK